MDGVVIYLELTTQINYQKKYLLIIEIQKNKIKNSYCHVKI